MRFKESCTAKDGLHLPARTPSAWSIHRCSDGFDAADRRRSVTRLERRYERPEAALEPRRLLHLRPVNPHLLLLCEILCFAVACNAALGEDEGSTNLLQQPRGLLNITNSEERTASCLLVISPCLCMFGLGKTEELLLLAVMPLVLHSQAMGMSGRARLLKTCSCWLSTTHKGSKQASDDPHYVFVY